MLERIPLIYYALSGLFNFFALSALAIFAFSKNPKLSINRIFSIFTLTASGWGLFHFLWLRTVENASLADFYLRTVMLFVIFMPATFTHFILTFLKVDYDKRINLGNYIISFIIGATVYTPLYAKNMGSFLVFPFWLRPGPFFHLHLLHFIGNVIYSHFLMFRALKGQSGILRNQVFYVFIGTAVGYSAGLFNYFPWYRIPIPPFLNPLVSVYVAFVSYAIIKFRLMDIKVALTRAGVFIAVYPLILGIPFWIGFKYLGQGPWILPVSIMAVFATAGPFIYIFLQRRAEEALLKERRSYQETINNLSESMIDIRDIDKLFSTITSTITEAIKIKFAVIYLKQEDYKSFQLKSCYPEEAKSQFQEFIPLGDSFIDILNQRKKPLLSEEIGHHEKINLDSGVVIPCFGRDGLIGFIILGAKQNHQMYTTDDLSVLETLSYNTSSTIENCTYWKEIEDRQRKARLQEMDTYSYSLAHEIYNPMYVISGEVGFLKKYLLKHITDPEDYKEAEAACKFALEASQRVSGMVEAIREFGAPVTDKDSPLKTEDIVETFYQVYYPKFKDKGIIFEKNIPQGLGYVRGQKPQLMQVLAILSDNAIQAMSDIKEKKITLKAEPVNQDRIRIVFRDSGHGIKKELLPIIFAPFTTTKASTEGTGMGLYNAKNMVERHKGKIWAESEGEGKGASFIMELPVAKDVKPEEFKKKDTKTLFINLPEEE